LFVFILTLISLALPVLSNCVCGCVFRWIVWWFPKDTELFFCLEFTELFFCLEFSEATDFRVWCENECVRLIGTKGTYHFRLYILIDISRFWLTREVTWQICFFKCYCPPKAIWELDFDGEWRWRLIFHF
jgi:hypothetical protein